MKVLFVNNYLYLRGGAEVSLLQTAELLQRNGHETCFLGTDFQVDNLLFNPKYMIPRLEEDTNKSIREKIQEGARIFYSGNAIRAIRHVLAVERPDIVHLNNIHHKLSPALVWEVKRAGLPIVWSLRDFKFVCPSYSLLNNEQSCLECQKGKYYKVLFNKCLKNSYVKSLLVMLQAYIYSSLLHIESKVDCFLPTSHFMRDMFLQMGFKGKMKILPNFVDIDKCVLGGPVSSNKAIYFGRLSSEKGLYTLLKAVIGLDIDFEFVGDGPEKENLLSIIRSKGYQDQTTFSGHVGQSELYKKIANSLFVVLPSEWHEPFGRTVLESFAMGRPVIGSRIGAIPELVIDNVTGLTFTPGDSNDLQEKMSTLLNNIELANRLGVNARRLVEKKYQASAVYPRLMEIYNEVM